MVHTFTMWVRNGDVEQDGPDVTIGVRMPPVRMLSAPACCVLMPCICAHSPPGMLLGENLTPESTFQGTLKTGYTVAPVDATLTFKLMLSPYASESRYAVPNGGTALLMYRPRMSSGVSTYQSDSRAGAYTRITVMLNLTVDLTEKSRIVVRNLVNSPTPSNSSHFLNGGTLFEPAMSWEQTGGVATFTVTAGVTAPAFEVHTVSFVVINCNVTQPSPNLTIQGEVAPILPHGVHWAPTPEVSLPGTDEELLGVPSGSNPMTSLVPEFTTLIDQIYPYALVLNTLQMTLSSNVDLYNGTTVTMSGLIGLDNELNQDTSNEIAYDSGGIFEPIATWDPVAGTMIFTIARPEGLIHDTTYYVYFRLNNPAGLGGHPRYFQLVGSGTPQTEFPPDGSFNFPIPLHDMTMSEGVLLGVEGAAWPFFVISIRADTCNAWQLSPFPGTQNQMTFKLKWSIDLTYDSEVAVEGLNGVIDVSPGGTLGCRVEPSHFRSCQFETLSGKLLTTANKDPGAKALVLKPRIQKVLRNTTYTIYVTFNNPAAPLPLEPPKSDGVILDSYPNPSPPLIIARGYTDIVVSPVLPITTIFHEDIIPQMPTGSLLGVSIPRSALAIAQPATCSYMAEGCKIAYEYQRCSFYSPSPNEAMVCLRTCNQTAFGIIGQTYASGN